MHAALHDHVGVGLRGELGELQAVADGSAVAAYERWVRAQGGDPDAAAPPPPSKLSAGDVMAVSALPSTTRAAPLT